MITGHSIRRAAPAVAVLTLACCSLVTGSQAATLTPVRSFNSSLVALTAANGSLWGIDGNTVQILQVNPVNGAVLATLANPAHEVCLAHDGTHLFETEDTGTWQCGGLNPNSILVADPATSAVQSTLPTPVGGGAGGFAFMGGSLWEAGAYFPDPCTTFPRVEIMQIHPGTGALLSHFDVEVYGYSGDQRFLCSDGVHLIYVNHLNGSDPNTMQVYRLSPTGQLLTMDSYTNLPAIAPSSATGAAWLNDQLYVSGLGKTFVFNFPATGPTAVRPTSWTRVKSLYR